MSKSSTFKSELLSHIFNNVDINDIGDAGGLLQSVADGNLYVRLYTDAIVVDDTTIGTECAYTGYVQYGIAAPRDVATWTVTANLVQNAIALNFGACTGGSENVRYFAIWRTNTDELEDQRLYWVQLENDLAVADTVTPQFAIGALKILNH